MRQYSRTVSGLGRGPARDSNAGPRAPIALEQSWRPRSSTIDHALLLIERSGVLPALAPKLEHTVGRPRYVSLKALLVGMMINGLRESHSAQITCIAGTLWSMSKHRLKELGCGDRLPNDLYKRVDYLYNRLFYLLKEGFIAEVDGQEILVDYVWFSNRIGGAPITPDTVTSRSVAIDGTAIETAARLHSGNDHVRNDGAAAAGQPVDAEGRPPKGERHPKARVLGYGIEDGRKVYTLDPDARGGYRTATNQRPGGTYVGYEAHFAVQTRDVTFTNGADKATLSGPVPGLILSHALVPAGSSRTDAVLPMLLDPRLARFPVDDVVVDPGYTIPDPHGFFTPLRKARIHVTWQITSHHAGIRPFNDHAFIYNGHLMSETLPERLRNLPQAPMGTSKADRVPYQEAWDEAARYRYSFHGRDAQSGTTRFLDPIGAGRVRSRDIPSSMRNKKDTPLVTVQNPSTHQKTVRATVDQLPRASKYLPGTTAHDIAYFSRRGVAESANAAFRGDFVNLDGRHFNVFEIGRIDILLGFTIAGYNLRRIAAFRRAHKADEPHELPHVERRDLDLPIAAMTDAPAASRTGDPPDRIPSPES